MYNKRTDDVMGVCGIVLGPAQAAQAAQCKERKEDGMKRQELKENEMVANDVEEVIVSMERGATTSWPTMKDFFFDIFRFNHDKAGVSHLNNVFGHMSCRELLDEVEKVDSYIRQHTKDAMIHLFLAQTNPDKKEELPVIASKDLSNITITEAEDRLLAMKIKVYLILWTTVMSSEKRGTEEAKNSLTGTLEIFSERERIVVIYKLITLLYNSLMALVKTSMAAYPLQKR